MKIAYFTDTFLPRIDGIVSTVHEHTQILTTMGHEVIIYAPTYPGFDKNQNINNVVIKRQPSIPFPAYKGTRIPFPKTFKIYQSLVKLDPDVIHIHTPGPIGLMGILISKVLKKPLVGTYHTLFSETLVYASPNELFKKLGIKIPNKKTFENQKIGLFFKKLTWETVNKIYSNCNLVLAPSLPIKKLLIEQGFKKNIRVLPSGIDTRLFSTGKNIHKHSLKILHVGRISYEKNVDVVLKAFQIVLNSLPSAQLIIAGDGPALEDMKKLSKKLGIYKNIEFIGFINRINLPKLYKTADVFVTASTMETLGLVVLEAMSCGLPIVAVNKYALPWIVKNNQNGFIVKPFDKIVMSEKIIQILKDKTTAKKFKKKSVEIAHKYEVQKIIRKLELIYQNLQK
jgi:glycosyltransferase involved in cell wall biosynthesis